MPNHSNVTKPLSRRQLLQLLAGTAIGAAANASLAMPTMASRSTVAAPMFGEGWDDWVDRMLSLMGVLLHPLRAANLHLGVPITLATLDSLCDLDKAELLAYEVPRQVPFIADVMVPLQEYLTIFPGYKQTRYGTPGGQDADTRLMYSYVSIQWRHLLRKLENGDTINQIGNRAQDKQW